MTDPLPHEARAALDEYLTAVDATLPGLVHGIYLTGSVVLDDWQPRRSDLDILTVTERHLTGDELTALGAMHTAMLKRPYRDATYIPAEKIGARPGIGARPDKDKYPVAIDGFFHREHYRPDPVLWATLDRHGLTIRGPRAHTLGADPGQAWLREWNKGNLQEYWRPWAAKARTGLDSRDSGDPLPGDIVVWGALGPGRLHATITTNQIISKTAAADYTSDLLPQYTELLARAKFHRLGNDAEPFTVADGHAVCDLVDAVVSNATGRTLRFQQVDEATIEDWRVVHNSIIPTDELSTADVRERASRNHLEVAYADDVLVGCSTVRPPEDGATTVIVRILPEHRRHGYGEQFYQHELQHAGTGDIQTIVLASNDDGLRFALAHGFKETDRYVLPGDTIAYIELRRS